MKVERLHIELTSKCNLKCPFCRHITLSNLPIKDLDFSIFEKISINDLKFIDLCGNVGEPTCYPDLLKLLDMINDKTAVKISTNGTLHQESWWKEVAKRMVRNRNRHIIFPLEGSEESHCRYRVGSNYKKLLKNIEAFTSSGGIAYAQFIVFKHNQYEYEDTKQLAKDLGCKDIIYRTSNTYNSVFERPDGIQTRHEICDNSNTQVLCEHLKKNMIFINFEGEVFPCCLSASCKYSINKDKMYYKMYQKYKKDINLNTTDLENIMNGKFYKFIHSNYKRLAVCQSFCRVDGTKSNRII